MIGTKVFDPTFCRSPMNIDGLLKAMFECNSLMLFQKCLPARPDGPRHVTKYLRHNKMV